MDQREQDSSPAPDVSEPPQSYPCVTPLGAKESTKASSDNALAEGGSVENKSKSGLKRVKSEIDVTGTATCQSSRLVCVSGESRERQSNRVVTSTVTGGQDGHYVRTATETPLMPDAFAQDEDGDT